MLSRSVFLSLVSLRCRHFYSRSLGVPRSPGLFRGGFFNVAGLGLTWIRVIIVRR